MNSLVDRIRPDSYGITTYLENLRRGQYQIPTFQRDVVWDRARVKKLWDSINRFYPLGSVLIWRTTVSLQNHRTIGGHELPDAPPGQEFQYILDGQQRTTALLTSIYGGAIEGRDGRDTRVYVNLTVASGDDLEDESWHERFVFEDEVDDRDGTLLRNVGRKQLYEQGLLVSLHDIAHKYSHVERRLVEEAGRVDYDDPARAQLRHFKQVFDNYKLSFIELRGIAVAEVCQIFERVNQAGQPLSMFDIVVAKTFRAVEPGVTGFYLRGLFRDFRTELGGSRYASMDDMTLLQTLAMLVRENVANSGVLNITDRYLNVLQTSHIEAVWDDAKASFRKTFDFLENHLGLPGPALVPFRYFYMTLACYFFRNRNPDYEFLRKYFWFYSFHEEDLLSNTTQLREHLARLQDSRGNKGFVFGHFRIDRARLRGTNYSSRGRLSRAILALYASIHPVDWAHPERSVLVEVYYTLTDRPNLHHIFPTNYCEQSLSKMAGRYADSLMNVAYLTQITNLKISDQNPLVYLPQYVKRFQSLRDSHLLPTELRSWVEAQAMPDDALDQFVGARIELVLGQLKRILEGVQFNVFDTGAAREERADDGPMPE